MVTKIPFNKPEYVFRPRQAVLRLLRRHPQQFAETMLPWGLPLRFRPYETLGGNLWRNGVYELGVSETIWRLLDAGECAADVGANIGYMSSVMAARVGASGKVHAFEPHPDVYAELSENVRKWKAYGHAAQVQTENVALCDQSGTAILNVPEYFDENRGTASLLGTEETGGETAAGKTQLTVNTRRLDDIMGDSFLGLMKLDVEGAELDVLRGAVNLLQNGKIRDIIFEEFAPYPTPTTRFLAERGYQLFRLGKAFLGVVAQPAEKATVHSAYDAPNYLATRDPKRALARLQKRGWAVYGHRV